MIFPLHFVRALAWSLARAWPHGAWRLALWLVGVRLWRGFFLGGGFCEREISWFWS